MAKPFSILQIKRRNFIVAHFRVIFVNAEESDSMTAENTFSNTPANELLIEVNKAKIATASILSEIVMEDINENSDDAVTTVDEVLYTNLSAADDGTLEKQAAFTGTRWTFWKGRGDQWAHIDPKAFPQGKKKIILLTVSMAGLIGPLSTTIYYPALETVQSDLNTTETLVNATRTFIVWYCMKDKPEPTSQILPSLLLF